MKFFTILAGMLLVSQTEQAIILNLNPPYALNGRANRLENAAKTINTNAAEVAINVIKNADTVKSQILPSSLTATNIKSNGSNQSSSGSTASQVNLNNFDKGFAIQGLSGSASSMSQSSGSSSMSSSSSSMTSGSSSMT